MRIGPCLDLRNTRVEAREIIICDTIRRTKTHLGIYMKVMDFERTVECAHAREREARARSIY